MARSPDRTTDTYLDVLRTLGVTDTALRRHHDVDPEGSLRLAIDRDRGSPTAALLDALETAGRVLDLRDGVPAEGDAGIRHALARFGFHVEIERSATDARRITVLVADDVTGVTDRFATAPDGESVEAALRTDLLGATRIDLRELLDGRHLVAERRELSALADAYGDRIQPFDDPLLAPDAAVDSGNTSAASDRSTSEPGIDSEVAESPTSRPSGERQEPGTGNDAPVATEDQQTPSADAPSTADAASTTEATSLTDAASTTETARTVLAAEARKETSGPRTHTIEDDEALARDAPAIGGAPRRTVATSGIDEVFDQLESSAPNDATERTTMTETTDTETDADESNADAVETSADAVETPTGLTGGPTRTVSSTSADDILERATGEDDFESIAAAEGGADPDAVLAEAEAVPPELDVTSEDGGDGSADVEEPAVAEEPDGVDDVSGRDCSDDAADRTEDESEAVTESGVTPPAADPAAPEPATRSDAEDGRIGPETRTVAAFGSGDASTADGADEQPHDDAGRETPPLETAGDANVGEDAGEKRAGEDAREARMNEEVSDARTSQDADDARTSEDAGDASNAEPSPEAAPSEPGTDPPDEPADRVRDGGGPVGLHGDDAELRRGTESVDTAGHAPPPSTIDTEAADGSRADGPLAQAGGVRPASDDGARGGAAEGGTAAADPGRVDDDAAEGSEEVTSTGSGEGLVGRIASRLFGR